MGGGGWFRVGGRLGREYREDIIWAGGGRQRIGTETRERIEGSSGINIWRPNLADNIVRQPEKRESRSAASGGASKESCRFRSRVKPEHHRHNKIPTFQHDTSAPEKAMVNGKVKTHKHIKIIPSNQFDFPSCTT